MVHHGQFNFTTAACFRLLNEMPLFLRYRRNDASIGFGISNFPAALRGQHSKRHERRTSILQNVVGGDIWVDFNTYARFLRECLILRALAEGKCVHGHMIKSGIDSHVFLLNNLVSMYAKCGSLDLARHVFDEMPERDDVSWNAIIAGYSQRGYGDEAIKFFCQMQWTGTEPNQFTLTCVIRACASLAAATQGKQVHTYLIKTGFVSDVYVGSALVDMYAKSKRIDDAHKVFDKMPMRDTVSFNTMIAGYAELGNSKDALQLFERMKWFGMKPDHITLFSVLKAFSTPESLERGKEVHAHIVKLGFESHIFVESSLVGMYSKCGCIDDARYMFDKMTEQNVVSWTTMIAGYAQAGYGGEALMLFMQLQQAGMKPDQITFASVLSACANPELREIGKQVHALLMKTGYDSDASVQCALVTMYAKCMNTEDARKVFDRMATMRDVVSWTTMLSGYAQNGYGVEALRLFCQMLRACVKLDHVTVVSILRTCASLPAIGPGKQAHAYIMKIGLGLDVSVGTALLTMYANCQSIDDAWKVFNKMALRDAVSWSAMIAGYVQQGHGEEAWKLLCQMQWIGMKPNQFTFASVLMACASLAAFELGRSIHAQIIKTGFVSDVFVGSALIDMYAKCGNIEYANDVFDKVAKVDVVLWNAMIAGHSHHGHCNEALQLFEQMQEAGLKPDHITFIAVLSACAHVGLVNDGYHYFDSMNRVHGITPKMEHYACMVDLLGRAGLLEEAVNFINGMPFKPGTVVLRTLLGACRIYANMYLGKHTAECLLELDPKDTATYVLLSNIYAAVGSWDDAMKVRKMMKDRDLAKEPGYSWIEVNHTVQVFVAGDRLHPQIGEIYVKLEKLIEQIKDAGYVPNTRFALHDVEQE